MSNTDDIPECLRGLDRDRRGYPIPVTAARGNDGTPYFTITDPEARHRMIDEDRCHLSGRKLFRGRWFIGGPMSVFHEQGAFLDGPMLDKASLYAVKTCPYIAARNYSKRVDDKLLQNSTDAGFLATRMHQEVTSDRPPLFVRVMTVGQRLVPSSDGDVLFVPQKPYKNVEFWRHGQKLDFMEGVKAAAESTNGEVSEQDVLRACGRRQ